MVVRIARHAGFCFGVKRAVQMVEKRLEKGGRVSTLGELIHNPQVLGRLSKSGVRVIDTPAMAGDEAVVIRSHGVAPGIYAALEVKKLEVIDATCPCVKRIHKLVHERQAEGVQVFVVGDAKHPEVEGLCGWAPGAVVLESPEAARETQKVPKAVVVAQTTITRALFDGVVSALSQSVEALEVVDTTCDAVQQRQREAAQMAGEVSVMIVVGGKNSANTRKLYEVCKAVCPRTHWVESADELPPDAFASSDIVGITAGASTPDWTIKEVVSYMDDMEKMVPAQQNAQTPEETSVAQVPAAQEDAQQPAREMTAEESLMAEFEKTFVQIRKGQTVKGTVVQKTEDEVCVNIGYKSDGIVRVSDLMDADSVNVGDEIEVEVVNVNDGEGNVVLSQRNLLARRNWDAIVAAYEAGEPVEAVGKELVKGGLIANLMGLRAFIPASQVSLRYVEKIDEFIGQKMMVKIIETDRARKRVVASRKAVLQIEEEAKKMDAWKNLAEGVVIKGVVRRLTDFGAFVDVGGVDGLVHVTDLSWGHVKHPSEVVAVGQEVDVLILSLDTERKRISLSIKQLQPKPWDVAEENYPVGAIVTGKVVRIVTFGAFVELEPGLDGLVHISQCALTRINSVEDAVTVGDYVRVKVLDINPGTKRISLSIREALEYENSLAVQEDVADEAAVTAESTAPVGDEYAEGYEGETYVPDAAPEGEATPAAEVEGAENVVSADIEVKNSGADAQ